MIDEKKWLFSWPKIFGGSFIILLFVGSFIAVGMMEGDYHRFFDKMGKGWCVFLLISVAIALFYGLKLVFSYCAYNRTTLFVYSFFLRKKINFEDIQSIGHFKVKTRRSASDTWSVCYWDKESGREKRISPQFPSGASKKMHVFFAALKAVHPCQISCYDYAENYEGCDDILDVWQEARSYESSVDDSGFCYDIDLVPFKMKDGDLSPLKKEIFDDEMVGKDDQLELASLEDSREDIKKFCDEWRFPEKLREKICSLVEKSEGYYKILKNGTEIEYSDEECKANYRLVKIGWKYGVLVFYRLTIE